MDTAKLFEKIYEYTDEETGLSVQEFENYEENGNIYTSGYFYNGDEIVGVVNFNYHPEEKSFEFGEVNLTSFVHQGIMTRYASFIGPILKTHKVKYAVGTFYSASQTLAENNGFVDNNVNDIGRSILVLEDWNN